jgi:hypothetical protein
MRPNERSSENRYNEKGDDLRRVSIMYEPLEQLGQRMDQSFFVNHSDINLFQLEQKESQSFQARSLVHQEVSPKSVVNCEVKVRLEGGDLT